MVSQWRYALRRHSSIHSGSSFLAESIRMTSSFNPGGKVSCSTSVMKPNWYSWVANCSMVLVGVCMASLYLNGLLDLISSFMELGKGREGGTASQGDQLLLRLRQLGEGDPLEGRAHSLVDAAPVAAHRAERLVGAVPCHLDALGDGDRALQRGDDLGHRDRL